MGQFISKERRANEDNAHEPAVKHDRLRVLSEDPRSPSGSITRTPIEVVATPDSKENKRPGLPKALARVEYSPAPSPNASDSPVVGLLKKTSSSTASELQRRLFHRQPIPKMKSYENDAEETTP